MVYSFKIRNSIELTYYIQSRHLLTKALILPAIS